MTVQVRTISVRWCLFVAFVFLVVFTLVATLAVAFHGSRQLADERTLYRIEQAQQQTVDELDRLLRPMERQVVKAGQWMRAGVVKPRDEQQLMKLFLPTMMQLPQCISMMVSDTRGWEFTIFREEMSFASGSPSQPIWKTRDFRRDEWGKHAQWAEWDEQGDHVVRRWEQDAVWSPQDILAFRPSGTQEPKSEEDLVYDPRQRVWHQGPRLHLDAGESTDMAQSVYWTGVDMFFTSKAPGITASVAVKAPDGETLVVAYDLLLRDLSAYTQRLQPSPGGKALVFTNDGKVLGLPADPRFANPERAARMLLQPLERVDVPEMQALIGSWRARGQPGGAFQFTVEGEQWWGEIHPYHVGREQVFWMGVAIPEADMTLMIRRVQENLWVVGALALLLAILLALLMTRYVSRLIHQLLSSSGRIAALELDPVPPVKSRLTEINLLAGAVEQIRSSLARHIEERDQAQSNLRTAEQRWHFALEGAGDGVWDWDLETDRVFYSTQWKRLLGFNEHEIGTTLDEWKQRVHPEDLAAALVDIQRHLRGESPVYVNQHRLRGKDGQYRWVLGRGKVVEWSSAGTARRLIGTLADITARVEAERALRDSEERFRSLFSSMTESVVLLESVPAEDGTATELRVVDVNPGGLKLLRRQRDEVVGRKVAEVFRGARWSAAVVHGCTSRREDRHPFRAEYRVDELDADMMFSIIPWGQDGCAVIATDITEQKRAEQERLEMEQRIQQAQKLESLGVLAGGIAHDFNNLLTGIMGNASLTREMLSPLSPALANVEEIEQASHRAADLCRQMLAYSGKGRFLVGPIRLGELIREMTHLLKATISRKAILRLDLDSSLPAISGDATQVRQIVMNMVINASEALGEGEGVIHLSTGVGTFTPEDFRSRCVLEIPEAGPYVWMEVADTGCGMEEAVRRRIFEPFFTTKFAGRGLGMSAVLGIVRAHKGALLLDSTPGTGTTFRVFFPCLGGELPGSETSSMRRDDWHGSGTVLLVDDEPTVRDMGKKILTRLGYTVLLAGDGVEAVELFRRHPQEITLVILDLTMPRMDGAEAFQAIRQLHPDVPMVLSSGYGEQVVVDRLVGEGVVFLQKPYTLDGVKEVLRSALARAPRTH